MTLWMNFFKMKTTEVLTHLPFFITTVSPADLPAQTKSCMSTSFNLHIIMMMTSRKIKINKLCRYNEGNAIILETDLRCLSDENMLLTCLQTKWPNIDVQWLSGSTPSINWQYPHPNSLSYWIIIIKFNELTRHCYY